MDCEEGIYRPSVNLDRRKCREVSRNLLRQVSRKWSSTAEVSSKYRASIEQQRIRSNNRSSINPPGVEKLSKRQEHSRSIHQVSRSCRDRDKKKAQEAQQIASYRGGIEEVSSQLFKTVFREEKNTDMNAIQYTTQLMIQST